MGLLATKTAAEYNMPEIMVDSQHRYSPGWMVLDYIMFGLARFLLTAWKEKVAYIVY
jgi:hypothetical protein